MRKPDGLGAGSSILLRDVATRSGNGEAPDDDAFVALCLLAAGLSMRWGAPEGGD
jgi:hypothetical protein